MFLLKSSIVIGIDADIKNKLCNINCSDNEINELDEINKYAQNDLKKCTKSEFNHFTYTYGAPFVEIRYPTCGETISGILCIE